MLAITATGSYGFFNIQVQGIALSILDDSMLPFSLPTPCQPLGDGLALLLLPAALAAGLAITAACGLALLELPRLGSVSAANLARGTYAQKALRAAICAHEALKPLGVGHSYGPFGAMTTFRWELIFETCGAGSTWTQVEFPYKPGDIDVRPRFMPVGHFARLDWRLWFVPLQMSRTSFDRVPDWVLQFVQQLLRGSPEVLALTASHKALETPLRLVRMSIWDYHLSSCELKTHACREVTLTPPERDAAYVESSCWRLTPRKRPREDSADASSAGVPPCSAARTEWGRWWYRRYVASVGTYGLGADGQLQRQSPLTVPALPPGWPHTI
eukprot:NODE_7822_length_1547_cov_4.985915.p1 GENE.NODE_7822_length_1547_cov_4.985915~~NODE_7822_length_1547_cov_4.985915.p1  ORF type:complete len:328 (+),score=73.95 NODE_7822_length_1547_cov_4.985915:257-1240(+)